MLQERETIMITKRNILLYASLHILLIIMFAGCAEAEPPKEEIEAGNPYMTEAIKEALL